MFKRVYVLVIFGSICIIWIKS